MARGAVRCFHTKNRVVAHARVFACYILSTKLNKISNVITICSYLIFINCSWTLIATFKFHVQFFQQNLRLFYRKINCMIRLLISNKTLVVIDRMTCLFEHLPRRLFNIIVFVCLFDP